jgi:hypothetical protein
VQKNVQMLFLRVSFLVLAGFATLLMLHVQAHAVQYRLLYGLPVLVVFIAMLYAATREWIRIAGGGGTLKLPPLLPTCLAVSLGSCVTVFLAVQAGIGAVLASSVVGALAAVCFPKYAAAAFCGSFVGMLCPVSFPMWYHLAIATAVSALLFWAGSSVLVGFGGKLGTTAFVGTVTAAWLTGAPLQEAPLPGLYLGLLILLVAGLSSAAAYVLHVRCKLGPVLGSSIVGLCAGVLLPLLPLGSYGSPLVVVAFCASFAGMSNVERVPTEAHALLAGLLAGGVFVFAMPSLGGAGGKLGTIAFVATLAVKPLAGCPGIVWRRIFQKSLQVDQEDVVSLELAD